MIPDTKLWLQLYGYAILIDLIGLFPPPLIVYEADHAFMKIQKHFIKKFIHKTVSFITVQENKRYHLMYSEPLIFHANEPACRPQEIRPRKKRSHII